MHIFYNTSTGKILDTVTRDPDLTEDDIQEIISNYNDSAVAHFINNSMTDRDVQSDHIINTSTLAFEVDPNWEPIPGDPEPGE